jgi:hypothetical protein
MDEEDAAGAGVERDDGGYISPRSRSVDGMMMSADGLDGDGSPRLTDAEAAELKKFAEDYEPAYIRSVHTSLICLLSMQVG